jgi:hypothetical protein
MKPKLICQECGGCGELVDDIIDMGDNDSGPITFPVYVMCGWCKGKGTVTKKVRGVWLRMKKEERKNHTP